MRVKWVEMKSFPLPTLPPSPHDPQLVNAFLTVFLYAVHIISIRHTYILYLKYSIDFIIKINEYWTLNIEYHHMYHVRFVLSLPIDLTNWIIVFWIRCFSAKLMELKNVVGEICFKLMRTVRTWALNPENETITQHSAEFSLYYLPEIHSFNRRINKNVQLKLKYITKSIEMKRLFWNNKLTSK